MHDGLQLPEFIRRRKSDGSQSGPVQRPVGLSYPAAEGLLDGIKESVVFPVKVLGGGIRVIDWNPAFRKNGADSGLAASDASGDSHSPHCRPSSTQSNTSGVTVHSMTPSGILEA